MTPDQILILIILTAAVVLFISERLRADVVALLVLLTLIVSGLLTVDEAFQGFASPAVVTVWAVFMISGGLQRSGVADIIARRLLQWAGNSETRLLMFLMLGAGVMSAFMNNIGAVAILMPAVISISRRLQISPSKLLMPLAFSALLGGNLTLIGTPPNILAVSLMQDAGIEPFAFFDFLPTGLLVLATGMIYMVLVGRYLIPDRLESGGLSEEYHVRDFLTEVQITSQSALVGQQVNQSDLGAEYNLNVIYVRISPDETVSPFSDYKLQEKDVLLIEGNPQQIVQASERYRFVPVADFSASELTLESDSDDFHLAEITLAPGSTLENQTIKEIDFRERYGLSVLALRHNGVDQASSLRDLPVRFGDSMLVQGPAEKFTGLLNDNNLLVLERPNIEKRRTSKIPLASGILLFVIVAAALGLLHVAALMLAGGVLMVLGGVLKIEEAYRVIDWQAVFLIAGMLPLGVAMEKTGTAGLIANQLVELTGGMGPVAVLATMFVLTALLTEVISNAAAAVLIVPIAIDVGFGLQLNPHPFVMATVIAASTSFLMPIGHQVNIIVFGAGGYKFSDYARVGVGLNLLLLTITAIFVPLIWPF
ncbi:MAG: SLC13 family permease [Ardenticatenaceae bacterium]|nr:SLC13 family permease [Ardenticatenaceae bacterium]